MNEPNSIHFELTEQDAKLLLEVYSDQLEDFRRQHRSVFITYENLTNKVEQLKKFLTPPDTEQLKIYPPNYPVGGSWNDKIGYILQWDEHIVLMGSATANEISSRIAEIEWINEDTEQFKKLKSSVYATLSASFKNGKYLRSQMNNGDYLYSINEKNNENEILEP